MERIRRREEREREREQEKRDREKRMRVERERDRERYVLLLLELFNCQVPCSLYLFSEITLLSTWGRLVFLRTLATVFIKNWRLWWIFFFFFVEAMKTFSNKKRLTLVVDLGGERISVHCYRERRTYVAFWMSLFLESNYVWEKMYWDYFTVNYTWTKPRVN